MSDVRVMTTASGCHIFSGCGYPAPSISDFYFKPIFTIGGIEITKPVVLAVMAAAIVVGFFAAAFARPKLVPRGAQNLGEMGVLFVRDQILRPQLGKKGDGYLPFLVSLFFFIWIMNIFGIIPADRVPGHFEIRVPGRADRDGLGHLHDARHQEPGADWLLQEHGGSPGRALVDPAAAEPDRVVLQHHRAAIHALDPAVRQQLAGHLLLLVFGLASWYLFSLSIGLLFAATSFALTIILTGLEVLIQALQAFIFTTLTAFYFADAQEATH